MLKQPAPLHTHTHTPSLETLAKSLPPLRQPPQGLHCQHLPVCPCSLPTDLHTQAALSFLDDACQMPPFPQIPIPIPHSRASQPKTGYASRWSSRSDWPKRGVSWSLCPTSPRWPPRKLTTITHRRHSIGGLEYAGMSRTPATTSRSSTAMA